MAWSVALGLLSTALGVVPAQSAPPPTLPPVVVTIAEAVPTTIPITDPTAVTVPTTGALAGNAITGPLVTSDASGATPTTQPVATPPRVDTQLGAPTITDRRRSSGAPPEGASRPPSTARGPVGRQLARPPTPRLAAAARTAAADFAPAEVLSLVAGLFLAANGVARRRGDLAHIQLDDRDAIVRFE